MRSVGAVVWFEIPADDVDRAKAFYAGLFGWRFTESVEYAANYWTVTFEDDAAAVSGGILQRAGEAPSGSAPIVYFRVTDLAAAVDSAVRLGGSLVQSTTEISDEDGALAVVRDTEGNVVGLWAA